MSVRKSYLQTDFQFNVKTLGLNFSNALILLTFYLLHLRYQLNLQKKKKNLESYMRVEIRVIKMMEIIESKF